MSDFAVCGRHGARCEYVFQLLGQSSVFTVVTATVLLLSCLWVFVQKKQIEDARARHLPLSSAKYPAHVPFYVADKVD